MFTFLIILNTKHQDINYTQFPDPFPRDKSRSQIQSFLTSYVMISLDMGHK